MPVFTPSFECRTGIAWRHFSTALFGCLMLAACAQPAAEPETQGPAAAGMPPKPEAPTMTAPAQASTAAAEAALAISTITLERDCSGCATGMRLELRRDGLAVATTTGKARLGTSDIVTRAVLPAADFDAMARQLVASGYFEMAEIHEEAGLQDGSWATLSVVRGGVSRQVFRREDAGPAALRALEAAMQALQARLRFVPDTR